MSMSWTVDTGRKVMKWVSDCCLTSNEFFFPAISWREQFTLEWDVDVRFVLDQHAESNFIVLAHLNKHSAGRYYSLFRVDQSLHLLINAACLAEKQYIQISLSLVWPKWRSNLRSIRLQANKLTITPSMW